jgi:hypothetical protein
MCNESLENKWLPRYLLKTVKKVQRQMVGLVWNLMAHGDAREGKWRGNRRMEWVASTILTRSRNAVYPSLLPLMRTTRLPVVDWTDSPPFKWTRPFRRKTNSGFCACVIRFQTSYTNSILASDNKYRSHHLFSKDSLHIYAQRVHQVARLKREKLNSNSGHVCLDDVWGVWRYKSLENRW